MFLKQVTLLFNRIIKTQRGKQLLKVIGRGLPFDDDAQDISDFNTIERVDLKSPSESSNDLIPINVLIYGPAKNCNSSYTSALGDFDGEKIAEIKLNPEIFSVVYDANNSKLITDPVITLVHELIHSLHVNYGVSLENMTSDYKITEELQTFGHNDHLAIKKEIANQNAELYYRLNKIVNKLNSDFKNNPEVQDFFSNKYMLEKVNGNYVDDPKAICLISSKSQDITGMVLVSNFDDIVKSDTPVTYYYKLINYSLSYKNKYLSTVNQKISQEKVFFSEDFKKSSKKDILDYVFYLIPKDL